MTNALQDKAAKRACQNAAKASGTELANTVIRALKLAAASAFGIQDEKEITIQGIEQRLEEAQQKARQTTFPLLGQLRPKRTYLEMPEAKRLDRDSTVERFSAVWSRFEAARDAAKVIGQNRLAVADALHKLVEANLIDPNLSNQICPICEQDPPTLTLERIAVIEGWSPILALATDTQKELAHEIAGIQGILKHLVQEAEVALPTMPNEASMELALESASTDMKQSIQKLLAAQEAAHHSLGVPLGEARQLSEVKLDTIATREDCNNFIASSLQTIQNLAGLQDYANKYREALRAVEGAIGHVALGDPVYKLRELWLTCSKKVAQVVEDLRWEMSKIQAQKDLQRIREILIQFRSDYLEERRVSFSEGMQRVWSTLREDRYSVFSQLRIPEPQGKGFPVVMEVKALLDDGEVTTEVDALKIFSESQVNALGIGAFITRSRLLGHNLLIFDDPVQSMDEDHFKTFARDVLPPLLEEGFQVLLLTHNDTFARDISYWHHDHPDYVTMEVRHSRRSGCQVDEGNRRVAERLKRAEALADTGQHKEAWRFIRLAIERLYLVTYMKYGPKGFQPDSWQKLPAEYMWDNGVASIVTGKVQGSGLRLKEMLDMTAGGAHDVAERGTTDILSSIKYLRSLLGQLQVGG